MTKLDVTPVEVGEVGAWHADVDVLVVGGGVAGACAAIEAARAGSKVLLVERTGAAGGSSGMSSGTLYLGGGTAL